MKISNIKNINRLNSNFNKFKIISFIFLILLIFNFSSCDLKQKDIREIELSDAVFSNGSFTKSSFTDYKEIFIYKSNPNAQFTLTVKSKHNLPLESNKIHWRISSTVQNITDNFKDENNVRFANLSADNTSLSIFPNFLDILGEYVVSVSYDGGDESKYSFRVDTTNQNTLANQLNMDYTAVNLTVKDNGDIVINQVPGTQHIGQISSTSAISVNEGKAVRIALSPDLNPNPFGRIKYKINTENTDVYFIENYGKFYSGEVSKNIERIGLKEITTSKNNTQGEVYLVNMSPSDTVTSITVSAGDSLFGKKDFSIISRETTNRATTLNDFTIASVPTINGNEVNISLQGDLVSKAKDLIAWVSINGSIEKTALYFDEYGTAKFTHNPPSFLSDEHTDTVTVYVADSISSKTQGKSDEKTIDLTVKAIKKIFDITPILTKDSSASFLTLSDGDGEKESEVREDISTFASWDDFKNKSPLKLVFTPSDITTPSDNHLYDDAFIYIVKQTGNSTIILHRDKYIVNGAVNTNPFTYEIKSTSDNAVYKAYMDNIKGQVRTEDSVSSYKVDVSSLIGRIMIYPERVDTENNTAIYKVKFIAPIGDVPSQGDKTLFIQYSLDKGASWNTPIQKVDLYKALGEENDNKGVEIQNDNSSVSFPYKSENVLIRTMIVSNKESKELNYSYICIPAALLNGEEYLSLDSLNFAPPVSIKIQDEFYNAKTLLITRSTEKDYKVSFAIASKDSNGSVDSRRPLDSDFKDVMFSTYFFSRSSSSSPVINNYIDVNSELNNKSISKHVIEDGNLTNSIKQGGVWKNRVWYKIEDPSDETVLPSYSYIDFDYEDCNELINKDNIVHSFWDGYFFASYVDTGIAVYDFLSDDYEYVYTWTLQGSPLQSEIDNMRKDFSSALRESDFGNRDNYNNYRRTSHYHPVLRDNDPRYSQVLITGKGKRTSKVYTSYPSSWGKRWECAKQRDHINTGHNDSNNFYQITSPSQYKSLMMKVAKK